jgi:hypothetical protein
MVDYVFLGSGLVFTQFWLLAGLTASLIQRIKDEKQNSLLAISAHNIQA